MSRSFKLFRLQQIDSEIVETQNRLLEIKRILDDDSAIRKASRNLETASSVYADRAGELRSAEQSVQTQKIKIEQSESTLYSGTVRNPKELEDLQNEVASLKRYLAVLEERQLEAMFAEEAALKEKEDFLETLNQSKSEFSSLTQKLSEERECLEKDKQRLNSERTAASNSIEPEDLRLYESIYPRRGGLAVSAISEKSCSSCGSLINSTLLDIARSPEKIATCDSCGRILYCG